ncbi:MAG: MFS transporter [Acidobacteria bacterium]|nr:MFS transporter [Acidobacteriota bacterium]
MYDWANSAFMTSVVTVFLGPYLTSLARAASRDGFVYPLGIQVAPQSYWPYLVSLSVFTQVLFLPIFGAIADYGRRKREMLATLAWIGALATTAMFALGEADYLLGGALFLVANISFGGSIVLYNAFLPEISTVEERDHVSSRGWGIGYLGGGLLLAAHLALFTNAQAWGLTTGQAVRIALASSGLWWGLFTIIPILGIHNRGARKQAEGHILATGFRQLGHTLRGIRRFPQTLLFLIAFLVYNDGIQTVINMATQFGSEELKLPLKTLTAAILLTQFVAIAGALLFDKIATVTGSRKAIMLSLVVWLGTLVYVYQFVHTGTEFIIAAGIIGVVLGGTQALSRSLFSFMIPPGQEAEYFSLYEISDKGTSWLGPLFLGLTLQWTGSFRLAIFSLAVFFLIGLLLLTRVDSRRAAAEAGNPPPAIG